MKTIRILALLEASTISGPAKNVLQFISTVRELGLTDLEVVLATFERSGRAATEHRRNEFIDAAMTRKIPIYCVREDSAFDPRVIGELRDVISRIKPDVIETHAVKSHFLIRLSGTWKKTPWLAFHHGYTQQGPRTLYNALDRWSLRAPNKIVTVNRTFQRQLQVKNQNNTRICVLHNAVPPIERNVLAAYRQYARQRWGICENERIILSLGRLSPEKAHLDLIAAVALLRDIRPELNVRLLMVGEGSERIAIERAAANLGLANRVILAGHIPDVMPCLAIADVLAISSLSEGSPNALLEAMAAGVPIVATAVGGITEMVSNGESALLVAARQPLAMALALEKSLCNPTLAMRLAMQAREVARCRYSPMSRVESLLNIYRELSASPPIRSESSPNTSVNNTGRCGSAKLPFA